MIYVDIMGCTVPVCLLEISCLHGIQNLTPVDPK